MGAALAAAGMGACKKDDWMTQVIRNIGSVRPRTLEWLLRCMETVFKAKGQADTTRRNTNLEPMTMSDYLYFFLSSQYGTKKLVQDYASQVIRTVICFVGTNAGVEVRTLKNNTPIPGSTVV